MATTEVDTLLTHVDESGNKTLVYPITPVRNVVDGADVNKIITTMTAEAFEALTTAEKAELYASGVRVIAVEGGD